MGVCVSSHNNRKKQNKNILSISTNNISILNTLKLVEKQFDESLCKIYFNENRIGNGFLCKIPFPDHLNLLPVLITNNFISAQKNINGNMTIKITFDEDKISKIICIDNKLRKIYTSEKFDITIIEILPDKDAFKISQFLEVDDFINEPNIKNIYENKEIYIIQFELKMMKFSSKINLMNDFNIEYNCNTEKVRPENPILLSNNNKLIGIHKRKIEIGKGVGSLIKYPIAEFINRDKNESKILEKKKTLQIESNVDFKIESVVNEKEPLQIDNVKELDIEASNLQTKKSFKIGNQEEVKILKKIRKKNSLQIFNVNEIKIIPSKKPLKMQQCKSIEIMCNKK